ncbi:MAG: glutathione S-transferase [Paracoccaceae bacterium]|jgi:glutathione S-transferase
MTQPELYFISGSPPCWSVMLALEVKGISYTPRRLDNAKREQKSPDYLKINPRGQVPVLIDEATSVCETLAVLSYLDAAHPEPPLFGNDPAETGRIWQAICECEGNLRDTVGEISRPLFRGKGKELAEQIVAAAAKVRDELSLVEASLSKSPWIAGDNLSAADLVVYPVIMQLVRAAAREGEAELELAIYPLADNFPRTDAWCREMSKLPGYENAYPPHWK